MVPKHWTSSARRRALGLILAVSCSAGSVFAQSPTFARTDYPFLGNDHNVGDFNGDGKIDLAGLGLQTAKIILGNGDGTFQPGVESPASSVSQVQALAPGDFNRDGLLDLMVTINDPNVGLSFLAGRGDGTFAPPVTFPNSWGRSSGTIAAVDLNNDLNLDVVIGHEVTCWIAVGAPTVDRQPPCRSNQPGHASTQSGSHSAG